MKSIIRVRHAETGETRHYTCSAQEAVIAAHAQERNDWNTWEYARRYGHMVRRLSLSVSCGKWSAWLETPGGAAAREK